MVDELILPEGIELTDLLENLRSLSWGAADILLAYARGEKPPYGYPQVLDINDSNDGPVTAADLAVNDWLIKGLDSGFPSANWKILSEENAKDKLNRDLYFHSEWLWILDPLDGTKDFLRGTGEYAVHIALVHKNRPVLGLVLIPELDELWFGVASQGAWCENRNSRKTFVSFSNRKKIEEMILVASRSHREKLLEDLINCLNPLKQKSVGSVGCKIGTILRGGADMYISLSGKTAPKDWDFAAPEAVLTAAGGKFTHIDQSLLSYNSGDFSKRGCIVASNGNNHEFICTRIVQIIMSLEPTYLS